MNELERITKRLQGVQVKRPGMALGLWGDPGIGKTHAVTALLRNAPLRNLGFHALTPLEQLARDLPRPKNLPDWANRALERMAHGEHVEAQSALAAYGAALIGIAPVIVHFEDIHEADPERLDWIVRLAEVVKRARGVALIVTSRTEPPEAFESVRLGSLSRDQTGRVLEAEAGAMLPVAALEWIHARAAGNPLYTLEFFRFLARRGFVWNDGQRWHWRAPEQELMPVTIEALIERMLAESTRTGALEDAITALALLPVGSSESTCAGVADLSPEAFREARSELERRGVLLRGEFAHPLYREVKRHGLGADRRQAFARRAVEALEIQHSDQAEVFVQDAMLEPAAALRLLERAAQRARALGDEVRAARLLARTLEYTDGEDRLSRALEAARRLRHVDVNQAMRLAEIARASDHHRARAVVLIAELLATQGHGIEAERVLETSPECGTTAWLARVLQVRALASNDAGVLELLRDHPEVLEPRDAETALSAARVLSRAGQLERAEGIVQDALDVPELDAESRVLLLKASSVVAYMRADFERMETLEREILGLALALGNLRWVDAAYFNRALALESLGRHRERVECLERAMQTCKELGDVTALAIAQVSYASALHVFGEYERAEGHLLEAHRTLSGLDVAGYLVNAEGALVHLYLDWQPPHGLLLARKHAAAALAHAGALGGNRYTSEALCLLARVEVWTGAPERALGFADEALRLVRAFASPVNLIDALDARGRALYALGRVSEALESLREAQTTALGIGDETAAQTVRLEADRVTGDTEGARERLNWFQQRGLVNAVNTVRRYFPALGPDGVATANAPETVGVRLEVLGPMLFGPDGRTQAVRGRKRQELLGLLCESRIAGRTEVSRTELIDALYPDSPEDQAASALKATVSVIRQGLGAETICTTANGYALGAVISDVEVFLETGDTRLWRGAYLDRVSLEPLESVRESLHAALFARAVALLETDPKEAARAGRILLEFDPYNLEYLRLSTRAMRGSDNHKTLTRIYSDARDRLLEVGEVIPERWQDFLIPA